MCLNAFQKYTPHLNLIKLDGKVEAIWQKRYLVELRIWAICQKMAILSILDVSAVTRNMDEAVI